MSATGVPRSPHPRASILIPAFSPQHFRRCLRSLVEGLAEADRATEVIAVLNGPGGELRQAAAQTDGLRVLQPPANLGLPGGLNLARAAAHGEYLVVLQDDAEIHPGWLAALVAVADAHPEAGVVCSAGLHPGGDSVQSAGVIVFSDASTHHVAEGARPQELAADAYAVDASSSAGMLVRASTWDGVGGLEDALFPLYWVDAALAMAVWRRGEAILCAPAARVEHGRHGSTSSRFGRFVFERNRTAFLALWGETLVARHEPPGEGAAARGLARAHRAWQAARPRSAMGARAPAPYEPGGEQLDRLQAGVRYAQRGLELRQAYAAALERELDSLEQRSARPEVPATDIGLEQLRRRSDTLAAIEEGGWWRLRARVLPMITAGGRLRSWLSGPLR